MIAESSGFIVQRADILTLPDSEGCSILVNLEFLNGTRSLDRILISRCAKTNPVQEYHLLPLAVFSAKVHIALPDASRLYDGSSRRGQHLARLMCI